MQKMLYIQSQTQIVFLYSFEGIFQTDFFTAKSIGWAG